LKEKDVSILSCLMIWAHAPTRLAAGAAAIMLLFALCIVLLVWCVHHRKVERKAADAQIEALTNAAAAARVRPRLAPLAPTLLRQRWS
jgi:uncharacterized membrane protein YqjE